MEGTMFFVDHLVFFLYKARTRGVGRCLESCKTVEPWYSTPLNRLKSKTLLGMCACTGERILACPK